MLFTVAHPTFDCVTLIAVDVTDKQIIGWIKSKTTLEVDDYMLEIIQCPGAGRTASNGCFTMIRFKKWEGSNTDISILTHEAFHLAEFIFDRIRIPHHIEYTGEVYAYFIQSTVKQILDKLKKRKKQ